jgi:TPR repeat protein
VWSQKAAAQNEVNSEDRLGYFYESGFGVTKDLNEAVAWYRKAAVQGNSHAQAELKRLKVQ